MRRNFLFLFVTWCFIYTGTAGQVSAGDRSYTKFLVDDHGNEILKLTVAYLGKEPRGDFEWNNDVAWRDKKLDFYTLAWTNLTGNPIDFVREESRTRYGHKRKEFRALPDGRKEIVLVPNVSMRIFEEKPRKEENTLGPYETQTDENVFYGIAEDVISNVAFWEVTFRYQNNDYVLEYHLVGTR